MIYKYGKEYGGLKDIKKDFYVLNEQLLNERNKVAAVYKQQPLRRECKLCGKNLSDNAISFCSHSVEYLICENCGHINGRFEDTSEFSKYVYCDQSYGSTYSEENRVEYNKRMETIYIPKVDFLMESLREKDMRILDIGAGSGYFCAAALKRGLDIKGVEISKQQVKFANQMIGETVLQAITSEQTVEYLRNTDRNVVSAIGVLEHVYNLREILHTIYCNDNIEYLYFSVPLFSLSVFAEMAFQNGFNRQLGGGHTHLFTDSSIAYMNSEFGFDIVGQWRFGTDVMDLYRFLMINLSEQREEIKDLFSEKFLQCADSIQMVLDQKHFCSEVHMLVSINRR